MAVMDVCNMEKLDFPLLCCNPVHDPVCLFILFVGFQVKLTSYYTEIHSYFTRNTNE